MNKIEKLFKGKSSSILSVYFTCGFPKLSDTVTIIQELDEAGVEMIEVGIPFSDPLADGPIIQHSSEVALKNGMNIKLLFEQLGSCKFTGEKQPAILLMGYLNPILQFGVEKFCKQASACGVDGLIIPDLPMQEYEEEFKPIVEKYGLRTIFLITPQTTDERIRLIDEHSKGFIYMVASSSTTGIKGSIDNEQ
ncbi:MAG: tryptophan synthase subunit alpha, partial [Bacteroidia bacterium]|nr:tryptophan synthase subunit alpha [Bacteroidia bacterium]